MGELGRRNISQDGGMGVKKRTPRMASDTRKAKDGKVCPRMAKDDQGQPRTAKDGKDGRGWPRMAKDSLEFQFHSLTI